MLWTLKCRLKDTNISHYVENNITKLDYSQSLGDTLHCLLSTLTDQNNYIHTFLHQLL